MNLTIILILAGLVSLAWWVYVDKKGYSNLIYLIGVFLIWGCGWYLYNRQPSFTGDPYQDAKIIWERLHDGESYYQVQDELFEYYMKKGYGMERAKETLNICSEM